MNRRELLTKAKYSILLGASATAGLLGPFINKNSSFSCAFISTFPTELSTEEYLKKKYQYLNYYEVKSLVTLFLNSGEILYEKRVIISGEDKWSVTFNSRNAYEKFITKAKQIKLNKNSSILKEKYQIIEQWKLYS